MTPGVYRLGFLHQHHIKVQKIMRTTPRNQTVFLLWGGSGGSATFTGQERVQGMHKLPRPRSMLVRALHTLKAGFGYAVPGSAQR